jgi:hypothetical protein
MPFTRQRHNGTKSVGNDVVGNQVQKAVQVTDAAQIASEPSSPLSAESLSHKTAASPAHSIFEYSIAARQVLTSSALLVSAGLCLFSLSAAAKPAKHSGSYKTAKNVRSQSAKPAQPKLTGVWGWTTGSQTYLRVRPGTQTPPVRQSAASHQTIRVGQVQRLVSR